MKRNLQHEIERMLSKARAGVMNSATTAKLQISPERVRIGARRDCYTKAESIIIVGGSASVSARRREIEPEFLGKITVPVLRDRVELFFSFALN